MPHTSPHPLYSRTVLIPAYDDAQAYLFGPMTDAHEAHTVMLAEQDIISAENAKAILAAVAEIRADGPDALAYQPGVEDLFFRMETAIIDRLARTSAATCNWPAAATIWATPWPARPCA